MADGYTPTTDALRDLWVDSLLDPLPRSEGIPLVPAVQAEFDRWLEAVRNAARAEGWDACASAVGYDDGAPLVVASNVNPWRKAGS